MTAISPPVGLAGRLPQTPIALRFAGVVLAVVVAFHYSLLTLLRSLELETPLAYLGLVPLIALGVGVLIARGLPDDRTVHDRQIDYIIGVPLLLLAAAVLTILPIQRSTTFWPARLDLVALPLFTAGAIALLMGVRFLARLKAPVAFLLLAWPFPYKALLSQVMDGFTQATILALRGLVRFVPVATPLLDGDGSRFSVTYQGTPFTLSVAAACAGVNGVVGFFIVGAAFLLVVKGKRVPKLLWLALGLTVIWGLNLVRIMILFAVGQQFGQGVAIDGLHPFIGLITFSVGVLAMIATLRWFRLDIPVESRDRTPVTEMVRRAVPQPGTAVAIIAVVALFIGIANNGLRSNELTISDLGDPVLTSFQQRPAEVAGWSGVQTDVYDHGKPYFGEDSIWNRYSYAGQGGVVTADVVQTSSLRPFEVFDVEACYGFHNYAILSTETVALDGGITGELITFDNPDNGQRWNTLNWIWPVIDEGETRFERIVLFSQGSGSLAGADTTGPLAPVRSLGATIDNVLRNAPAGDSLGPEVSQAQDFLAGLATAMVQSQAETRQTAGLSG